MILVDTSIWVGHLRAHDAELARLIDANAVYAHPYVIGEIALGSLRQRGIVLNSLQALPQVKVATHREVSEFIERRALFGQGIGYVDACLLAAASLTAHTWIWTHDRKLAAAAASVDLAAEPPFAVKTLG